MNVLNPGFLTLAALAVPLIALYILKLRRREVRISSTLLWEQAVRDLQANAPFQRLRANLLLLLQLLLLALLVFALARPALRRQASPGSVVVLVVDTSASMGAVEGGRSRLALALEAALGTLERLGETDEAMVVEAWRGASVVAGFSRDRTAARRALESLRVRDTATYPADALLLAASAIEKRDGARVLFFSDGAFDGIPGHPVLETSLTWVRTGGSAENTGITAFRAEVVPGPDGVIATRASGSRTLVPCSVFAAISNFTQRRRQTYATLKTGGEVVGVRAVTADAGETVGMSFEASLPAGEAVEIEIDDGGALAADDRAWTRVPEPVELRVQVAGEQRFVRAFLSTRPALVEVQATPDVWFGEGEGASPPDGCHAVWFRPGKPFAGILPGEPVERVRALSWDETHDLLRFARFGDVHVARASRLVLPGEAANLVQGSAGPLLAAAEDRGFLRIAVAFRPGDSDWPLRPSFPIFISNVLRAAGTARSRAVPVQIEAGDPARFSAVSSAVAVIDPSGRRTVLEGSTTGESVYPETDTAGLYVCETAAGLLPFGVNLLSEAESRLASPAALGAGERPIEPSEPAGHETLDIWPWLAGAALALFLIEWACFHRRVA